MTVYEARFVLSDQETLVSGGKQKGRWPYEAFYNAIISMLDEIPYNDFNELMAWWNEYALQTCFISFDNIISRTIFGDISLSEDEEVDDQETPTAASLMRQQIKARQGDQVSRSSNEN